MLGVPAAAVIASLRRGYNLYFAEPQGVKSINNTCTGLFGVSGKAWRSVKEVFKPRFRFGSPDGR